MRGVSSITDLGTRQREVGVAIDRLWVRFARSISGLARCLLK